MQIVLYCIVFYNNVFRFMLLLEINFILSYFAASAVAITCLVFSAQNLANFIIGVTDVSPNDRAPSSLEDSEYTVCAFYEGTVPLAQTVDIQCSTLKPVRGRYLFILRTDGFQYLQLCELEVYAWA